MSNLSALKEKLITIELEEGKVRNLRYDMNAFAELEEKFGSIDDAMAAFEKGRIKAIIMLLWAGLIHEDETLTTKNVGSFITMKNMKYVSEKLNEAFAEAMPAEEKEEGTLVGNE